MITCNQLLVIRLQKNVAVIRLQILLKNDMITYSITFTFRKSVCETNKLWQLCVLSLTFNSALKKGASLSLFMIESDHKSETTMLTHQMCLMDHFCCLLMPHKGESNWKVI
jgi:hypothetical protein